jgi:hypothetical protein
MQTETLTVTVKLDEEQIRACLPRCATCRHWKVPPEIEGALGVCFRIRPFGTPGNAWVVSSEPEFLNAPATFKLFAMTGGDFGCILHESREAPNA